MQRIDSHGLKAVVLSSSLKIRFVSGLKGGDFPLVIKFGDQKLE